MAREPTSKKPTKPKTASAKSTPAGAEITTLPEALGRLESLGDAKTRAHDARNGAGDQQFGVKHGDFRVLAKKIKADHEPAMSLWETGNLDARYLAILLMKPRDLSAREVDRLVRSTSW